MSSCKVFFAMHLGLGSVFTVVLFSHKQQKQLEAFS